MNIYGVTGYLTPDNLPEDRHCRTFRIPNDVQWLSVFMGALLPLIYPESWQEYGELTPDEAADAMLDVITEAYTDDIGVCPDLGAPYWDTAANIDDEFPDDPLGASLLRAESAPEVWFGELKVIDGNLTWVENLFIWGVAGFIAYAGQPAAAIAFVPFAQRFVLAFKQHDLGGIVNVFIDGELVDVIDTYQPSASIGRYNIFTDNSGEPHTLWVEMSEDVNPAVTGDPFIQVVRKELDEGEVSPTNLRYNVDCDCVQQTYDGGDTWVDQPGQDPRSSPTFQFPPIVADDPRCQAAANMAAHQEDIIGGALGAISTGLDAVGVATTILSVLDVFGPFAILIDLAIGLAGGLIALGVDVINAEFTPETYEALTCIYYCDIQPDGTVTQDDLAQIQTDIAAQLNPDVQIIMGLMFSLIGFVGLTNQGASGDAAADCDACDCGWCYQFLPADGNTWVFAGIPGVFQPDEFGTFDSSGWHSVSVSIIPGSDDFCHYQIFDISKDFTAVNLTRFEINFNMVNGRGGCDAGQNGLVVNYSLAGTVVHTDTIAYGAYPDGDNQSYVWTGDMTVDHIDYRLEASAGRPVLGGIDGSCTTNWMKAKGIGMSPFPPDNC